MALLSPHFSVAEFTCHCGCGLCKVSASLLDKLELIRSSIGRALVIKSGCRCIGHNLREGGKANSRHLCRPECTAADISVASDEERGEIVRAAIKAGFGGVGVAKTFVHCDERPVAVQRLWLY